MEAELAAAYDAIADQIFESPSLYRDALTLAGSVRGDVLDIGCGQGRFLEMLGRNRRIKTLSGCDISPRLIEMAKARVPNASLQVANALDLSPYPDCSFDFVSIIVCLEYLPDHRAALAAAFRVLKPGGRLVVASTNAHWVSYQKWLRHRRVFLPTDEHWFKPDELAGLLQAVGFKVEAVRGLWALYRGNWLHRLELLAAFFIRPLHRRMKLIGMRAVKP